MSDPLGQPGFHLRPALRVTDMALFGALSGTVAEALVTDADCSNDLVAQTGNAVYVYNGMTDTPGDIGDAENDPFTTATVMQDEAGRAHLRSQFPVSRGIHGRVHLPGK